MSLTVSHLLLGQWTERKRQIENGVERNLRARDYANESKFQWEWANKACIPLIIACDISSTPDPGLGAGSESNMTYSKMKAKQSCIASTSS